MTEPQVPGADDPVRHEPALQRFALGEGAALAVCDYRRSGDVLVLHHTAVPPVWQGHGVAARLVQAALAWARGQGLRVRPVCSYVAAYMRRHPETLDLVE